jgi:hypothetical protein
MGMRSKVPFGAEFLVGIGPINIEVIETIRDTKAIMAENVGSNEVKEQACPLIRLSCPARQTIVNAIQRTFLKGA